MPDKKKSGRARRGTPWWRGLGGYLLLALGLLLIAYFLWPKKTSNGQPWKEFSGDRALANTQALVNFGPRPPATAAIEQTRAYIRQNLEANGWQVIEQPFTDETPRGPVKFVNLIARRFDQQGKLFFIGSHYDTKTFDKIRFVGADDGGSSTGALLELGRVLNLHPDLAAQIELIFFDGEEAYDRFTPTDGLYGSRHFAVQMQKAKKVSAYRGGIVWDMIGDKNLTITLPLDSPPELAKGIFAAADALGVRDHFTYLNDRMIDDHSPFNVIGVPTIDLIDFDYPPWHTAEDTMDKLSAQSLQIVGQVTLYFLVNSAFK